jgi:hypothetical protein
MKTMTEIYLEAQTHKNIGCDGGKKDNMKKIRRSMS